MARIRSIKPEFWDSPGTARATLRARLFFIAMWNWADDWGIGDANAKRLVGFAFPNDDDVSAADYPALRGEVSECFDVEFYSVDGREYYAIPSWEDHQRTEKKAKRLNPGPDEANGPVFTRKSELPTLDGGLSAAEPRNVVGRNRGTGELGTGEKGTGICPPLVDDRTPKTPYSETFEQWWPHYPKRESKGDAFKAWEAARKARTLPPLPDMIAAADTYARKTSSSDPQFVKLAGGWLRDRKWEDEPARAGGDSWAAYRA